MTRIQQSAAALLVLITGGLSADTLTRTLTTNANWWEAAAWLNGTTPVDWEDGNSATIGLNGKTLTLDADVKIDKLIFSDVNTAGAFISANGAIVTITNPFIELNGTNSNAPQFKAGLALNESDTEGIVSVKGIGESHKGGNGSGTEFEPASASENITAYRFTAGVFRILNEAPFNGKPIIFAGGGLVQAAGSKSFSNPLIVETSPAYFRTYGSATATASGAISNKNPETFSSLHHTDGGNLYISGDLSGFYGEFVETSGNFRFLPNAIDTLHTGISMRTTGGQFYIQPERNVTFPCTITGNANAYQDGGTGTVTFTGQYTTTGTYVIRTGTLNLIGRITHVKTEKSGAALTGSGTITGNATLVSGATVKAEGGLTIGTLILPAGAILEGSAAEPLVLGALTLSGKATLKLPANLQEGEAVKLFTLPDSAVINFNNLSVPAGYRIATAAIEGERKLYSLVTGESARTRTITANADWENPGEAVWIDAENNTVA